MSFFARSYKVGMRFFIGMRKHFVQICAPGNKLFFYYAYLDFAIQRLGYLNCQIK